MELEEKRLRELFPNASEEFFKSNCKSRAQLFAKEPERDVRPAVVHPAPGEEKSDERIIVSIVMHRVRTLDPDNATGSVKPLVDCLRYIHLIPDDSSAHIDLKVTQEKVSHYRDQKTEVKICYPKA